MMSAPYDDQNIFAKILRGEIPSHRVYEDEHAIAIMDVMPQGKGHTLVIPKAASRNLLDIDPQILGPVMTVVQKLARAVRQAFDAPGVVVTQFNEPASGQTVFHTHFHVIPRFDGVPLKPHTGEMADPEGLKADADRIRKALARN
jgi:histidine triad (HIT) family protein